MLLWCFQTCIAPCQDDPYGIQAIGRGDTRKFEAEIGGVTKEELIQNTQWTKNIRTIQLVKNKFPNFINEIALVKLALSRRTNDLEQILAIDGLNVNTTSVYIK